eukprot:5370682-Prymnesium_polylepis.1
MKERTKRADARQEQGRETMCCRVAGCVPQDPLYPRRAAATASTHTHRASPRGRTGRPPARPGA